MGNSKKIKKFIVTVSSISLFFIAFTCGYIILNAFNHFAFKSVFKWELVYVLIGEVVVFFIGLLILVVEESKNKDLK